MARQAFIAAKPNVGETINNFITRLQKLAEHCDYDEERDNQVRDHAISYIKDRNLKSKLYREETLTLHKLMEIVSEYHDQEALILLSDRVNNIQIRSKNKGRCWRCNKAGHYARECRSSRDHKCGKCGKVGHFEVCCHSGSNKPEISQNTTRQSTRAGGNRGRNKKKADVRQVTDGEPPATEFEKQACERDYYHVFSAEDIDEENFLELKIEDKFVKIVIDSGASCNLVSHEMLNFITGGKVNLLPCDKKIYAYAAVNPLELAGKCKLNVYVPQTKQRISTEFYVTSGRAVTLLGRKASEALGLLKVGVSLHVSTERKALLKAKFPKVFQGLGKLEGYQLKFHIDPEVEPIAQPVRRIPFSRRSKVIQKIEELVELDVIEKVEGPTGWVNPLVVVEKPNGDVRICLDMRRANKAIKREKHPVPTAEEILQEISEAKVFTKLDLNMAFHQIELHPDSRDITTFAAPNGLYRYKRLLFGVNMATEKFQNIVWQVIKDCPGAYNIHDDLRVVGATDKEHDENLERVLKKLEENGLTLNYEKCEIGVDKMVYMGNVLSGDGLQLSEKRVKAIIDAPEPKNQSEVRSFLGSSQFCAKFIQNFATMSSPLWDLTKKDAKWKWRERESRAVREIKEKLTCAPVLAYHRRDAKTRLITDASPVGLGAVLEQEQEDSTFKPIYYASRKLSNVERRYSQFEREALAVRWACEKFYLYLYGIEFEICTDHKPLVIVLGENSKSRPPSARIERWLLYLQQFKYKLTHIRGKDNRADSLSRLPVDSVADTDAIDTEDFAYSVANGAMPVALASREVELVSENDVTLKLVRQAVLTGDWSRLLGTKYEKLKDEFWIVGQVVMRGSRIVMPESLWKRTVVLAHEGHQGIVRTKSRLREKVWWPGIDKQVEDYVRSCHPCQIVGSKAKPEPIRSTKLPESPWKDISVDLLEITSENHLLVVVDYYSRWIEAILLRKTDAQHVIKSLEAIFRTHGLPETIRSDNGPPFTSREFEAFLKSLGIIHKKGVPYWPQSNGEVERCNATLLKIVRIARLEGKDWKKALEDFLFHYRVTPHTVTDATPAELLMGRKLRDKLPRVEVNESRVTEAERKQLLKERDARKKLRQKQYADKTRAARDSNIGEGDRVLLKQTRKNKLTSNFEPHPYKVVCREGNAVVVQDSDGDNKMRAIAHMKKYVEPQVVETKETVETTVSPSEPEELTAQPVNADNPDPESSPSQDMRPLRARRPPVWMKDYVLK